MKEIPIIDRRISIQRLKAILEDLIEDGLKIISLREFLEVLNEEFDYELNLTDLIEAGIAFLKTHKS